MLMRTLTLSIFLFAAVWIQPVHGEAGNVLQKAPAPAKIEAPVVFNGKVLFTVGKVLSFPPASRASAIAERIEKLSRDPLFSPGSFVINDSGTSTDVVAGDTIIMSITDGDAAAAGKTRQALARSYAETIRSAMEAHNREYSARSLLLGSLYAIAATAVLVTLLILLWKAFPRVRATFERWRGTRIRSIKLQSFEILHEDRIAAILISATKGAGILLVLVLFYFYIPLVLSFFPWTRGHAAVILGYVTSSFTLIGQQIWAYLPKILFIAVILFITFHVIKLVKFFFAEIGKGTITLPGFYTDWAEPTFKIVRFLILAFVAVVVFPYLPGSESSAFKGISIFLGVLFSLGSTSAVANVIAGVILIYMRAFKVGDRVKIADTIGDIVEKNLLVTRIRTVKNVDITVPNSIILGSHIFNFSSSAQSFGLVLHTRVTIGYDAPWRKVRELLIAAARSAEHILSTPEPFVLQVSLDDFYVTYELNAYTDRPDLMQKIYSELHQNIQDRFNEAGVEIMSPHYTQIRDGNSITIPEDYIAPGYEPGGLRIFQTVKTDREK